MNESRYTIKDFRNKKGLSQEKLSEKSGLSLRTIQRIENGETIPRGDSLTRIQRVLDIPADLFDKNVIIESKRQNGFKFNSKLKKHYYILIIAVLTPCLFWSFKKSSFVGDQIYRSVTIPMGSKYDIPVPADFDGDNTVEVAVWRPHNGFWYISTENQSWNNKKEEFIISQFGAQGDIAVPADYNGDGKEDIAVFRPSEGVWYISLDNTSWNDSIKNYKKIKFGVNGDIPVPGNYDEDKEIEIAVWRPQNGFWYISMNNNDWSNNDSTIKEIQWGKLGDIPVQCDYDGDGKTNIAIYRPEKSSMWYISLNNTSFSPTNTDYWKIQWGASCDVPQPMDYNGDGKMEIAVWRPENGEWYINMANESYYNTPKKYTRVVQWGGIGDFLTPNDYDGDGKDEIAVWRPRSGEFYISTKNRSWDIKRKVSVGF